MRHALFKHFMSNEHAFRNKLRSGHSTCQKLICDMRNMTAWQHDSMTAWQGDRVTSPDRKSHRTPTNLIPTISGTIVPPPHNLMTAGPPMSPHVPCVPLCPCVIMSRLHTPINDHIDKINTFSTSMQWCFCVKNTMTTIIFTPDK